MIKPGAIAVAHILFVLLAHAFGERLTYDRAAKAHGSEHGVIFLVSAFIV